MFKRVFSFRLRTEILFNIVIVMVASMLLISLMVLKFSRDFMALKLEEEHAQYAFAIEKLFKYSLKNNGFRIAVRDMQSYLSSLASIRENLILAIYDFSHGGAVRIYSSDEKFVLDEELEAGLKGAIKSGQIEHRPDYSSVLGIIKSLKAVETYIPVLGAEGQAWTIYIGLKKDYDEKGFRRIKLIVILYTGLFALIVIAFGYAMLSRSIVKPLERISGVASRIASGDLTAGFKEEEIPGNEVGELARSIRKMTEILLGNQKELSEKLIMVERLNRALSEAQLEIVRVEKLASIGRLSSGIAHEIGNPLSAVMGYVDMLKKDIKGAEEREMLVRSEAELQRISRIIKQLLDFSRPSLGEPSPGNLNECIVSAIENLKIGGNLAGIAIDCEPLEGQGRFIIDEGQLRQVLINVLKNAADAVREKFKGTNGGKIVLRAAQSSVKDLNELESAFFINVDRRRNDPPGKFFQSERVRPRREDPPESDQFRKRGKGGFDYPKFIFAEDDRLIKITVEDNGAGIKKEDFPKIFDPFYTTKDPGYGTGLGLYMTLNMVDSMGGYIDLISEYGKGTLFLILLPAKN